MANENVANSLVSTRKRLLFVFIAVILVFVTLFGRLFYIQVIDGKHLQAKAAEQWYRDLPLVAPRGIIYDVNGIVLADNKDVYAVYVRPKAVTQPENTAAVLSQHLKIEYNSLLSKIRARAVSEITVGRQVAPSIAKPLIAKKMAGVYFTIDSKRNYPKGNFLSQVIGFTNIDNKGQNGLEGYYDTYLAGTNGFAYTATDIKGIKLDKSVTKYVPAISGSDLRLTIDANIQAFAAEAVFTTQKEFESKSASMIVLDAKTGGILAMAITPSFDLNEIPRGDLDLLNALSKNTMMVDVYEPGSTFKVFTVASAIEHEVTHDKKTYFCPGYRIVDGQRIKCWKTIGHGSQTLPEGVQHSCNCAFMDMALELGTDRFYSMLRDFGLGAKTNVDFFGESNGLLMNQKSVKSVDLARIGFGHAIAVTPLQLAIGVAAAVNGGTLYEPYFVKSISTDSGETYYEHVPKATRQVVSEATSAKVRELLTAVVTEGGGKKAGVDGFSVGGKTGTAQKYNENGVIAQGKYVSSFVGFAPAENPDYVILTIVDEPSGYMYYGSLVAAPATGQVFKKIFDYKGLKPTLPIDTTTVIMPELTGKEIKDAEKILKGMGLVVKIAGEGSKVAGSVPIATTIIPSGDVVLLRTD